MNKALSIALLIAGVVMIVFGINASDSASSHVSRFFNGAPTNQALWLLIGGVVLAVVGLVGSIRGGTKNG